MSFSKALAEIRVVSKCFVDFETNNYWVSSSEFFTLSFGLYLIAAPISTGEATTSS